MKKNRFVSVMLAEFGDGSIRMFLVDEEAKPLIVSDVTESAKAISEKLGITIIQTQNINLPWQEEDGHSNGNLEKAEGALKSLGNTSLNAEESDSKKNGKRKTYKA